MDVQFSLKDYLRLIYHFDFKTLTEFPQLVAVRIN